MKIYLDDKRKAPEGWTRTNTVKETIDLLRSREAIALSLDHDLGTRSNGNDVLLWLEEQVALHNFIPPDEILIHSANAGAKPKMLAAIASIKRLALKQPKLTFRIQVENNKLVFVGRLDKQPHISRSILMAIDSLDLDTKEIHIDPSNASVTPAGTEIWIKLINASDVLHKKKLIYASSQLSEILKYSDDYMHPNSICAEEWGEESLPCLEIKSERKIV